MSELFLIPIMLAVWVAPIAAVVWLLVTVHRMSKDVAQVAQAVRYLADRAAREDDSPA